MDRLAFCCLLFMGSLHPLLSLPVIDSGEGTLQLPALEDARLALEELERASLLQTLRQATGTEASKGLGEPDSSTDVPNPRGNLRKAFSRQDSKVLSRLLARTRKQRKQHGTASECFWKYCI